MTIIGHRRASRPFRLLAIAAGLIGLIGAGAAMARSLPVPAVVIYPGDIIRDTMLADREVPDDFGGGSFAVTERSALIGKTARHTLLPGQLISSNAVAEPKVVALGAMVRVVFVEGGLAISTYASALQAGSVGDVIPVRNMESGLTVSGIIQSDGSVRVSAG